MLMVVVIHELESIKIFVDRVIMLVDGKIQVIGMVEELIDLFKKKVYDFFYRIFFDYVGDGGKDSVFERVSGEWDCSKHGK